MDKGPLIGVSILTVFFLISGSYNVAGYEFTQSLKQKMICENSNQKESFFQTFSDTNIFFMNNKIKNYPSYNTHYFLIWRVRGEIRDLKIGQDDHVYHFNTSRVVSSGFLLVFFIPFVPIPLFRLEVSRNEEWWLVWGENHLINKEHITENYIDFFCIDWSELTYPD